MAGYGNHGCVCYVLCNKHILRNIYDAQCETIPRNDHIYSNTMSAAPLEYVRRYILPSILCSGYAGASTWPYVVLGQSDISLILTGKFQVVISVFQASLGFVCLINNTGALRDKSSWKCWIGRAPLLVGF